MGAATSRPSSCKVRNRLGRPAHLEAFAPKLCPTVLVHGGEQQLAVDAAELLLAVAFEWPQEERVVKAPWRAKTWGKTWENMEKQGRNGHFRPYKPCFGGLSEVFRVPAGGVLLLRAFGTDLAFRLQLPDGGSQEAAELRGAELESFLEALWGEMSGVSQAFRQVFRPFLAGFWLVLACFWMVLAGFARRRAWRSTPRSARAERSSRNRRRRWWGSRRHRSAVAGAFQQPSPPYRHHYSPF